MRSKMADGSREGRADPKQMNDLTFSATNSEHGDTNKCSANNLNDNRVKLSFYVELETSGSCERSSSSGVAANCSASVVPPAHRRKSSQRIAEDADERKKRCFDRYDSSESSDSGVVVSSPTGSGGCSGSDITEPGSPCSPASSCGASEDSGASARMPPWASESAPAGPRRVPQPPPTPTRRPAQPPHRRITEFYNHKMKPHNGLKRDSTCASTTANGDIKRKCLPNNGVSPDIEKYISYLSQTLSPRVLLDVSKQSADSTSHKQINPIFNGTADIGKKLVADPVKPAGHCTSGLLDFGKSRDVNRNKKVNTNYRGILDGIRKKGSETTKDKLINSTVNGVVDAKKQCLQNGKKSTDPSANGIITVNKQGIDCMNKKITTELIGMRIAPATHINQISKSVSITKVEPNRMNGVVSTTTKLDSKMNGVTCGSNNLSLNSIASKVNTKKEPQKKILGGTSKRTNRKSSACIANSKNLTWSKANNLKQAQLQQQNCVNLKSMNSEVNGSPKMGIPNGVTMTMNGNISNINVPVTNLQNCHQINISQACNGTVGSTNIASFVAMPHNVMLTTLRIPQNGITAQNVNQHNNLNAFNRANVSVTSPTKINGQFVFPLVQNLNGAVVQIPNLMAKVAPNFVLPQTQQITAQRQDHNLQTQQAQILINGTLLKLANTMTSPYPNLNKSVTSTSMSIPVMNKNVAPGVPTVGMAVQSKPSYTVNISHPVLVPQPGFFVNSVPNIHVKETWSNPITNSVPATQNPTTCANPIAQHPPANNITSQTLHSSSIPIAPVKPPDKPNHALDPPIIARKETQLCSEIKSPKCDIPWLSKTVNNNNLTFDTNKMTSRPFAQVCHLAEKLPDFTVKTELKAMDVDRKDKIPKLDKTSEELRRIEEVARREETIFTQITVLKDVSSNVQNTVIETNFSSVTNESSESGIGTDKSIDSPSDSQTSKECDEDSSLSLSVSVCSVDVSSSQKSPILKQPKTLRFPPRNLSKLDSDQRTSSTDTTSSVTVCLWEECKHEFDSNTDLIEHLQMVHVESQAGRENYVCLWAACKVRGKPSCSRLWLERHALSHGGNKPFKCIFDGCTRRFSTQILLERHVNNHLTNEQSPNTASAKKTTDSAPKLIRRNGKKLRYRRQPWSARMFDHFDAGMMEGLAWRLARGTRWRLGGACPLREPPGRHTLTLHAALAATRYNAATAAREALVTYYPPHILEDEWVPEKAVERVKRVEISQLPAAAKVALYEQFCSSYRAATATPARALLKAADREPPSAPAASGAAKRKLGRRHGGNSFWPCGR